MRVSRDFLMLIFSQLFSIIGTVVIQFVLSLYILDVSNSALTFSVITSLAVVGRLLVLPFCGILTDRFNKKKIMIIMDSVYFLLTFLILIILTTRYNIFLIGLLTCLMGMISAFETPVVQASIPLVCRKSEIAHANSIISSIGILGNMLGPVIEG